jgi:hypothetical protein
VKEENPEAPAAGKTRIEEAMKTGPKHRTFIYVNNRLKGNALGTTAAMIGAAGLVLETRHRKADRPPV